MVKIMLNNMIVFQKYILFKKRKNTSFFLCKFFLYLESATCHYQILKKINFWKKTPYIWSFLKKKIKLNFD